LLRKKLKQGRKKNHFDEGRWAFRKSDHDKIAEP
jgi:hypothetical protein